MWRKGPHLSITCCVHVSGAVWRKGPHLSITCCVHVSECGGKVPTCQSLVVCMFLSVEERSPLVNHLLCACFWCRVWRKGPHLSITCCVHVSGAECGGKVPTCQSLVVCMFLVQCGGKVPTCQLLVVCMFLVQSAWRKGPHLSITCCVHVSGAECVEERSPLVNHLLCACFWCRVWGKGPHLSSPVQ